jgi:hypothetical protein
MAVLDGNNRVAGSCAIGEVVGNHGFWGARLLPLSLSCLERIAPEYRQPRVELELKRHDWRAASPIAQKKARKLVYHVEAEINRALGVMAPVNDSKPRQGGQPRGHPDRHECGGCTQ